jgi:hypothetical protein
MQEQVIDDPPDKVQSAESVQATATQAVAHQHPVDDTPSCMYIEDCDTGSQLRKAVSHIFGRNKMCTRRIPQHVWVWYCRKHYQRARYRNAKEWAKTLQYDLVKSQINRLEQWSEGSRRLGHGDVVKDYELVIRKREQRRIDAQRVQTEPEHADSGEETAAERHGEAGSSTAVPAWLRDRAGANYSAEVILEVIERIRTDLDGDRLSAWPDIEILPNIGKGEQEEVTPSTRPNHSSLASDQGRSRTSSVSHSIASVADDRCPSLSHPLPLQSYNGPDVPQQKRKREAKNGENEGLPNEDGRRFSMQAAPVETLSNPREQEGNPWLAGSSFRAAPADPASLPQRYPTPSGAEYRPYDEPAVQGYPSGTAYVSHKRARSDIGAISGLPPQSWMSPSSERPRLPPLESIPTSTYRPARFQQSPHFSDTYASRPMHRSNPHAQHISTSFLPNPYLEQERSAGVTHNLPEDTPARHVAHVLPPSNTHAAATVKNEAYGPSVYMASTSGSSVARGSVAQLHHSLSSPSLVNHLAYLPPSSHLYQSQGGVDLPGRFPRPAPSLDSAGYLQVSPASQVHAAEQKQGRNDGPKSNI